jgi:cGMP-dependent protein kinase
MTSAQKDSIAQALITVVFRRDDLIVSEGDQADSYYILKTGKVSVLQKGKIIAFMGQGDSFGEQALFQNCTRLFTLLSYSH